MMKTVWRILFRINPADVLPSLLKITDVVELPASSSSESNNTEGSSQRRIEIQVQASSSGSNNFTLSSTRPRATHGRVNPPRFSPYPIPSSVIPDSQGKVTFYLRC